MQVVDCMRLNTAKGQAFPLHSNDPLAASGKFWKCKLSVGRLHSAGQPAHFLTSSLIHSNLTFLGWLSLTCVPVLFIGYQHWRTIEAGLKQPRAERRTILKRERLIKTWTIEDWSILSEGKGRLLLHRGLRTGELQGFRVSTVIGVASTGEKEKGW